MGVVACQGAQPGDGMKKIIAMVLAAMMTLASGVADAAGKKSSKHYPNQGGHYVNPRTGNHYTHHK